jgi:hypothetical protein
MREAREWLDQNLAVWGPSLDALGHLLDEGGQGG